jgi:hypothetical protein
MVAIVTLATDNPTIKIPNTNNPTIKQYHSMQWFAIVLLAKDIPTTKHSQQQQ